MTDGFEPIRLPQHDARVEMVTNVYEPIPVIEKQPPLTNWTRITIDRTVVDGWGNMGQGTGMRTAFAPTMDIDIRNEDAAALVEETIRQCLGDDGKILVRIGMPPNGRFRCALRSLSRRSYAIFAHRTEVRIT